MIFHEINVSIERIIPNLVINGIQIDRLNLLIFLVSTNTKICPGKLIPNLLQTNLQNTQGFLTEHFLLIDVLRKLYFSMVQSQLQYGILASGFDHSRLNNLQKHIIRIISESKYKSHCDPLFRGIRNIENHGSV